MKIIFKRLFFEQASSFLQKKTKTNEKLSFFVKQLYNVFCYYFFFIKGNTECFTVLYLSCIFIKYIFYF